MLEVLKVKSQNWWQAARKLLRPVYLLDGHPHDWDEASSQLMATDRFFLFAVIARADYTEQTKTYPAMETNELRKVVQMESQGQQGFSYIWPRPTSKSNASLQKRHVTFWTVNKALPSGLYISMPETKILADTSNQHVFEYSAYPTSKISGKRTWVTKTESAMASATSSKLIEDAQDFIMTSAVGLNRAVTQLTQANLMELLINRPISYWLNASTSFYPKVTAQAVLEKLLPLGVQTLVVGTLYLMLSSAYLVGMNTFYQNKVASFKDETRQLIDTQSQLEEDMLKLSTFNELAKNKSFLSRFFPVFIDLKEKFEISAVKKSAGLFIIEGTAKKATDVLEMLTKDPRVVSPRFDQPTTLTTEKERFVISFRLAATLSKPNDAEE